MIGKNFMPCNLEDISFYNNFNSLSKEVIYNNLLSKGYHNCRYRLGYLSEYKNDTEDNLDKVSYSPSLLRLHFIIELLI